MIISYVNKIVEQSIFKKISLIHRKCILLASVDVRWIFCTSIDVQQISSQHVHNVSHTA